MKPNPDLDPIQDNCPYGYVLPDRCRYTRHLGCACGAYPPIPPVTAETINSRKFPRGKIVDRTLRLKELEGKLKGPYVGGMTEYWERCRDYLLSVEDLEGKCMALHVLSGGPTGEEWTGEGCDCRIIQGTYNCKLNPY